MNGLSGTTDYHRGGLTSSSGSECLIDGTCPTIAHPNDVIKMDIEWCKDRIAWLTARLKREEDKNAVLEAKLGIVEAQVNYLMTLDRVNQ